jgi:hypothetical protein
MADVLQEGGHLLLKAYASSPTALQGTMSQHLSNTLWAAAVLRWYNQHLFAQGAAAFAALPPAEVKPQEFSNALYACAICSNWDDSVQQLLSRVKEDNVAAFRQQDLGNSLFSWAVLCCTATTSGAAQQHIEGLSAAASALFQEAAARPVNSIDDVEHLSQLCIAHLYAEQHLHIPGLPDGPVLAAARAAGRSAGQEVTVSVGQREVACALQQLGYTVQLEMQSPDGLMNADIGVTALPDGSPCSIAVEYDGPYHYVTEYTAGGSIEDRLEGPTRLRNALLQPRFPDGVVCIPWYEWKVAAVRGQQEEYLRGAMAAVLKVLTTKVGVVPSYMVVWVPCMC